MVGVVQRTAVGREVYVDNLKVVLITAIIMIHAVLGYAGLVQVWTYTELREVTLAPVTEFLVFVVAAPFGFFLIGLLFLVAGLFTAPSLDRKGVAAYTRERVLRLGVPYVVYVLAVGGEGLSAYRPGQRWRAGAASCETGQA